MANAKQRAEREAEAREALEEKVADREVAQRHPHGDTEGHVEGPVGTWNTSGTEVAKPTALQRDRYDEQNRNDMASHGMTAADHLYRRAQAGDKKVLAVVNDPEFQVAPPILPQNNMTIMAAARGTSLQEAVDEAKKVAEQPRGALAGDDKTSTARKPRKGSKK